MYLTAKNLSMWLPNEIVVVPRSQYSHGYHGCDNICKYDYLSHINSIYLIIKKVKL